MMTRIVECDPEDIEIDMEVEVVFHDLNDEFKLPYFRPLPEVGRSQWDDYPGVTVRNRR